MQLKILTLNCAKGYIKVLNNFLSGIFAKEKYDFVLLQEFHQRNMEWFKSNVENYSILRAFNAEVGKESELAIAYKKEISLKESKFYSFAAFKKANLKRVEWGLLVGCFQTSGGELLVASVHLNALANFLVRIKETKFIKKSLLDFNVRLLPIIFGGDFNNGLLGEKSHHYKIFSPEFVNLTKESGVTVDSRYVEPAPGWWGNQIAVFLAKFGIGIRMKVDHLYTDKRTAETHTSLCKVFPDRVSDHSAMEVVLSPK